MSIWSPCPSSRPFSWYLAKQPRVASRPAEEGEAWPFVGARRVDGAEMCGLGPRTVCGMELRVAREGVGIGVSFAAFVKMLSHGKLWGDSKLGPRQVSASIWLVLTPSVRWLRLLEKRHNYQVGEQ